MANEKPEGESGHVWPVVPIEDGGRWVPTDPDRGGHLEGATFVAQPAKSDETGRITGVWVNRLDSTGHYVDRQVYKRQDH